MNLEARALGEYLTTELGPTTVTAVKRTYPGHSRETWLVDTVEHGGLVVRADHPGGPIAPVPLFVEFELHRRLWGSAIPVAEPLFYAEDRPFVGGRPHMVRRLVKGRSSVTGLTGGPGDDPNLRRAVCFEMAEKLALVHTFDWSAVGLHDLLFVPTAAETALHEEVAHWRRLWSATKTGAHPLLTEATYWLEEQIPPLGKRRCLLKGNNGIGEEIWRDLRIVALSDWELATVSDPSLDWAFSQGLLSLHDPAETLQHYASHSGFAIDWDLLAWAAVWIRIKSSMTTNSALAAFVAGHDDRVVRPALGIAVAKGTEAWVARALREGRGVLDLGYERLSTQRSNYLDGGH